MSGPRVFVAAALLSLSADMSAFAKTSERYAHPERASSGIIQVQMASHSWCLHSYVDDEVDCSYASRSQCVETAIGGLGECSLKRFGRRPKTRRR